MENNILLSIISPVYNAERIVAELVRRISEEAGKITPSFEIILVDDGSPDNSWDEIAQVCRQQSFVKGIRLSRNFGQHYAITAGIEAASGKYIIVMDCDLQDNPSYIHDLYREALSGFEIVYTEREERKHSALKNFFSSVYYRLFHLLSGSRKIRNNVGSYSLITRRVADAFLRIKDFHRHYIMVLSLLGFRSTTISIKHEERYAGKTSYTFRKLLSHALDGITSQSVTLLRLSVTLGFLIFIAALVWALVTVVRYFMFGSLPGYTSLMVTLLISTGLILMSIGIAGIYIGKIFEQVKGRPLYLVQDRKNFGSSLSVDEAIISSDNISEKL